MSKCPICGAKYPKISNINGEYVAECCETRDLEIDRFDSDFADDDLNVRWTAAAALAQWMRCNEILNEAMQQEASDISGSVDAFDLVAI